MRRMRTLTLAALTILAALYTLVLTAFAAGSGGTLSVQLYSWTAHTYTPAAVEAAGLTFNGVPLTGDVPAMVLDGRVLVPVRQVGEALEAQVLWDQESGQVRLARGEDLVVLTLDSAAALVNGVSVSLPDGVPAQVVVWEGISTTMVPLRFVSEGLGAGVTWDQASFTAHVTAGALSSAVAGEDAFADAPALVLEEEALEPPDEPFVPQVTSLQWTGQSLIIVGNHTLDYQLTDLGDRLVVDVRNAVLADGFPPGFAISDPYLSNVSFSEHGANFLLGYEHTVRFMIGLRDGATVSENLRVTQSAQSLSISSHDVSARTIVVDPGHGGAQPGAYYEGILEKDIDLSVSLKLADLLRAQGYQVILTRSDDTAIGLYERADLANAAGADLFVSIHSNAAENRPDYQGIYTYYYPGSQQGLQLAKAIQPPVCALTGAIDRGVRDADFVVLRETDMCAVLVEMGFMSNHEELMRLVDDGYQQLLARGIAQGITNYLNAQADA